MRVSSGNGRGALSERGPSIVLYLLQPVRENGTGSTCMANQLPRLLPCGESCCCGRRGGTLRSEWGTAVVARLSLFQDQGLERGFSDQSVPGWYCVRASKGSASMQLV